MKKIMKSLKKIPALFMLVLSIVMPIHSVFAITGASTGSASTVDEDNVAITIAGIEDLDKQNVEISVYHLIDVNIDDTKGQPQTPVYTWDEAVVGWVQAHYSKYIDTEHSIKDSTGSITNYAVSAEFTPCDDPEEASNTRKCLNAADAKKFYDEVANAIRSTNGELKNLPVEKKFAKTASGDIAAWTEDGGKTKISGITMGNKLVLIEKGMNVYQPSAINIVPEFDDTNKVWTVADTDLVVKYTTPSIDKTVEEEDEGGATIGSTLNYKIKVLIPTYPENATAKTIEIRDKFDSGLTFDPTSVKVYANATDDFDSATLLTVTTSYTLDTVSTSSYTFKVTIDNTQYETLRNYKYVYVTYKGTINANAIVTTCTTSTTGTETICPGNNNVATLNYNNNPYDTNSWEDGKTDTATIYTYGIKIDKIDEDLDSNNNKVYLPGAKFSISTTKGGSAIGFVKVSDGVYRKAITETEAANNDSVTADAANTVVTELEVSSAGKLEVIGLAKGTYYVTETEAPEGYVKLQNPVEITITDTDTNGLVEIDGTEQEDGYVFEEVKNSNDITVLPITGGIGTILFSVLGILFMGLGAFLIKNSFKKEDVQ